MFRLIHALLLSLTLALTSYSMAMARGQSPDIGTDMVICTGVGMITMTIGADGEPVKATHICPDAMSIFAATLAAPALPIQPTAMGWRAAPFTDATTAPQETLSPSARAPPLVV